MHKVSVREINAIVRPMVLFIHTNEIKPMELAEAYTDPTKNHRYHGDTPPLGTHKSLLHLPLPDTSVSPAEPPICPRVETRDAAVLARTGYLPDVCLQGANIIIYRV